MGKPAQFRPGFATTSRAARAGSREGGGPEKRMVARRGLSPSCLMYSHTVGPSVRQSVSQPVP